MDGGLSAPRSRKRNQRKKLRKKEAAESRAEMSDGDCSVESKKSVQSARSGASQASEKSSRFVPSPSPRPGSRELPPALRKVTLGGEAVKSFKPGAPVEDSRLQAAVMGNLRTAPTSPRRKEALKRSRTMHPGAVALAKARLVPPKASPPVTKGGKSSSKGRGKSGAKGKALGEGKAKGETKGRKR